MPDDVLALRQRQAKNLCCLLLLANGIPMLTAGDELLQTQGGNNNPYNQDNATTWLDWSRRRPRRPLPFRPADDRVSQGPPDIGRAGSGATTSAGTGSGRPST